MVQTRKVLLALLATSFGSVYGMEKEQSSLSELPSEVRRYISSLLLEKEVGYNYSFFKKMETETETPVSSVVFSPEGKTILTGSYDNTANLWDIESGKVIEQFTRHTSYVYSAIFSPD